MWLIQVRHLSFYFALLLFGVLFFGFSLGARAAYPVCSSAWNVLNLDPTVYPYPFQTIRTEKYNYPCFVYLSSNGTYYYSKAKVTPILITSSTIPPSLFLWALIGAHFFLIFWYYVKAFL